MNKFFWIPLAAVVFSFVGGFLIASSINRNEIEKLRSENERLKKADDPSAPDGNETDLTSQEIDAKIAEADRVPGNVPFQKNLGTALYRYAAMKKDADLLEKAIRILDRADVGGKSDQEVLVTLGNAYFDLGYYKNENASLARARELYKRVLEIQPDDVEVRTDLGLTYYLQQPPDLDEAIREFQASLKTRPEHQKTLQFLVQALVKKDRTAEAELYLAKLKTVYPSDPSISELTAMVEKSRKEQR